MIEIKIFSIICTLALVHGTPIYIEITNEKHIEQIRYAKKAEMHNYLNESVDPCDNFYNFACGNWKKINPADTVDRLSTGFFETIAKALDRKISIILQEEDELLDTDIDKKVKHFYKSCTRMVTLDHNYKTKLKEIVEEFGKIPALELDKWDEDKFDWLEVISKISYKYGISIILGYEIKADLSNNTVNRLYIGHPEFTLKSKSMYVNDTTEWYRTSYQYAIASDLTTYWSIAQNKSQKIAKEILNLEIALAKAISDDKLGLQLNELNTLTTLEEMHKKYSPTLDTIKLVNISMGSLPALTEPIYELFSDYQVNLVKVLRNTSKRKLANYIYFKLLSKFILRIPQNRDDLQSKCISNTKKYFAKILDNMVYRKYNSNRMEQDIEFMWNEIKLNFKNMLESQEFNWISVETRKYAVEKLDVMKLEINSYASENFTKQFGDLILTRRDYVENLKNILKLNSKNLRKSLYEPPKPYEEGVFLSYTPANIMEENRITIPVSLLQPYYLWSMFYPNALTFGALGSLVGHELIHGFDHEGRTFDKFGNSRQWWDEESTQAFNERQNCFVDQYKKYIYNGRPLPEMASQSENIADNGGLHIAYQAYLNWYESAIRSNQALTYETLPRFNYTSKQIFFISYAQLWCSDVNVWARLLQTSIDSHVPGEFRVIGPLSNFEEFSKEFKCPAGSGMNPEKKCSIY